MEKDKTKLPKWAQELIRDLEEQVKYYKELSESEHYHYYDYDDER